MAFTFCTSEAIVRKAGANANATIAASGTALAEWSEEAESFINVATRINYTDTYASLNVDKKKALADCASAYAAMYVIDYDMSGFTSRLEAQTMLDVLRDKVTALIKYLEDKKHTDFVSSA